MEERIWKTPLTVNELLFQPYESSPPFFRKNPENQLYCLVIEYIEGPQARTMIYNGFVNGVFSRVGNPNPLSWDLSEPDIKLTNRAVDHFQNNRIFVFVNALEGIDIPRVRDKVYSIDMRHVDLKSEFSKAAYMAHQQALKLSLPSSQ